MVAQCNMLMLSPCLDCEAYNYFYQTIRLCITLKCIHMSGPIIMKFISALRELATYKELIRSQVSGCILNHYSEPFVRKSVLFYKSILLCMAHCSVFFTSIPPL